MVAAKRPQRLHGSGRTDTPRTLTEAGDGGSRGTGPATPEEYGLASSKRYLRHEEVLRSSRAGAVRCARTMGVGWRLIGRALGVSLHRPLCGAVQRRCVSGKGVLRLLPMPVVPGGYDAELAPQVHEGTRAPSDSSVRRLPANDPENGDGRHRAYDESDGTPGSSWAFGVVLVVAGVLVCVR